MSHQKSKSAVVCQFVALMFISIQAQTATINHPPVSEPEKSGLPTTPVKSNWTTEKMKKAKPLSPRSSISPPKGKPFQAQTKSKD